MNQRKAIVAFIGLTLVSFLALGWTLWSLPPELKNASAVFLSGTLPTLSSDHRMAGVRDPAKVATLMEDFEVERSKRQSLIYDGNNSPEAELWVDFHLPNGRRSHTRFLHPRELRIEGWGMLYLKSDRFHQRVIQILKDSKPPKRDHLDKPSDRMPPP